MTRQVPASLLRREVSDFGRVATEVLGRYSDFPSAQQAALAQGIACRRRDTFWLNPGYLIVATEAEPAFTHPDLDRSV